MTILEIIRLEETPQGTIGVLKIDKEVFCFTLEPPDKLNVLSLSSIPAKQYICKPYLSSKHGPTWEVQDVPGRSFILFHAGNIVKDTEGCILLGDRIGKLRGDRAVLNSGITFNTFLNLMKDNKIIQLTIKEDY